jgi:predicted ArsR family transcriptional regulator
MTRLSHGEATVDELAEPFPITKQAVSRHIQLLEAAELITRSRDAQRRPCHLNMAALDRSGWITTHHLATRCRVSRFGPATGTAKEQGH